MFTPTRFRSLVHYVCSKRAASADTLGAVKLNKILWLADQSAFYERGKAITDSRYIKREFGPVPAAIIPAVRDLEKAGYLTVRNSSHYGKQKKTYLVHVAESGDFLEPEEREIVDRAIDHVCDEHTAASVSEASHNHIWKAAEVGEELPLFTVFAKPGVLTDSERQWAQLKLESDAE